MVKRAGERTESVGEHLRESQTNGPEVVQPAATSKETRALAPEHPKSTVEAAKPEERETYASGQEIELFGLDGERETWKINVISPEGFAYLEKVDETADVPYVEVLSLEELQYIRAALDVAKEAEGLWDAQVKALAATPGAEAGAEAFLANAAAEKARILRHIGLQAVAELSQTERPKSLADLKSSKELRTMLNQAIREVLANKERRDWNDQPATPRVEREESTEKLIIYLSEVHRQQEGLPVTTPSFSYFDALRVINERKSHFARLRQLDPEIIEAETTEHVATKNFAKEAWDDLRVAYETAERRLKDEPNVFVLDEMIQELTERYHVALARQFLLTAAKARGEIQEKTQPIDVALTTAVIALLDRLSEKAKRPDIEIHDPNAEPAVAVQAEIHDHDSEPWLIDIDDEEIEIDDVRDQEPKTAVTLEIPPRDEEAQPVTANVAPFEIDEQGKSVRNASDEVKVARKKSAPKIVPRRTGISENAGVNPPKSVMDTLREWWKFFTE